MVWPVRLRVPSLGGGRVAWTEDAAGTLYPAHAHLRRGRVHAGPSSLDTRTVACAESRSLRPDRWDWLEVREYLVLKYDGTTVRYPVQDGDVAQARLRADLTRRPDDDVVLVTDDAYFRVAPTGRSLGRLNSSDSDR